MINMRIFESLLVALIAGQAILGAQDEKKDMGKKAQSMVDKASVEKVIASWPEKPKALAEKLMAKYGAPNEITPTHMIWYHNGPWHKTMLSMKEIPHSWPVQHTDFLEQEIHFKVPADKFCDLARFDGSVIAERTKGTLAARCDREEHNLLGVNLAHDVATGKKTVDEARKYFEQAVMKEMKGEKDPYAEKLMFEASMEDTGDPDQAAMKAQKETK